MRIILTFAFFLLTGVGISAQKIYRVNSMNDVDDGQCNNMHCSLREAINEANADGIASILWFELNGTETKVIRLASELPAITAGDLTIDGNTLASNLPTSGRLTIDGQSIIENGFDIQSSNIKIYGLQFQNFLGSAIFLKNASMDINRTLIIGRRKKGNIFVNNGYALYAENLTNLTFQANYVGTNLNFEQGLGNRNGIFVNNDWDSFEGASLKIGGEIGDLEGNYFVNSAETALDITYHGAGVINGNVFGTGPNGTEQMGNNLGIRISNLHGRIDIGGSPSTKNIFAYNDSGIIVNRNNFIRVSENSFYCNNRGFSITENAYPAPVIELGEVTMLSGKAGALDFIEIYETDAGVCNSQDCQGLTFLGVTRADADGLWTFQGSFKYGQQIVTLSRNGGRQSMFSECLRICPLYVKSTATNAGPYCEDDVIELTLEPEFKGSQWISNFSEDDIVQEWIGPDGYVSSERNPETAIVGGQYIAQAYLFGCPSIPDTTEVVVTNIFAEIEGENTHCRAENIALNSLVQTNANHVSYQWTGPNNYSSNLKNPTDIKDAGAYNLMVTAKGCQSEVASITIENHFPEPYSLGTSTALCEGEVLNLQLPNAEDYKWSGDFELTCDTCQSISFVPTHNGTLAVNIGPTDNCYTSANLAIEVLNPITNIEERILCPGSSLSLLTQNITAPGTYTQKYIGANGCDSTQTYIVVSPEPNAVFESKTICEGETLIQFGQSYSTSGVYQANFTGANGCDSSHTVELTVLKETAIEETFSICAGESKLIFGNEMSETASVTQTFTNQNGCDSTHTIHLFVKEAFEETDKMVLCAGETATILDDLIVSESGVYQKEFVSNFGCDSMVMIEVEVLESIITHNVITMCEADALATYGAESAFPTDYQEVLTTQSGCDSTNFVSYNILSGKETMESISICSSEAYYIDGKLITTADIYTTTYTGTNGCDSLHSIDLKIYSADDIEETFSICAGESKLIFGNEMSETASVTQTFTNQNGCDYTHTIHLSVKESFEETDKMVLCAGETATILDDLIVSESGVYQKEFVSNLGCDSMVMIEVEVLESIITHNVITMCEADALATYGAESAFPTDYQEVLTAQSGCDSTNFVSYNILSGKETMESISICSSEAYYIDGKLITTADIYTTTYTGTNGCDSLHSIDLKIYSADDIEETFSICAGESKLIFGNEMSETASVTQTFTNQNGCDYTHTIHLSVKESFEETDKMVLCAGETATILDDLIVSESGVYQKEFVSNLGCDSMVMIEVEVMEPITSHTVITMCEAEAMATFGAESAFPSDYEEVLTAQSGCDSTSFVAYNILLSEEITQSISICSSEQYLIDGAPITTSGRYVRTYAGANGCDSVHITNLTVIPLANSATTYELCVGEQIEVFGEMVSENGDFSKNFTTTNGCDSMHTITVFVKESLLTEQSITICEGESITVFDKEVATDEQLSKTFSSINGCDSTHTIQVNVLKKILTETEAFLCEANCIELYGAVACANNIFQQTMTASSGCDSIHTVNLRISEPEEMVIDYTICEGDSMEFAGSFLKEPGVFSVPISTLNGCGAIQTVNLTVASSIEVYDEYILCPGDSLAMFDSFLKEEGVFSKTYTSSTGCDSSHTVNLIISNSKEVVSEYLLCEGDSLAVFGNFIKDAGAYSETYVSASGCDSIHTMLVQFTSPIIGNIVTTPSCFDKANGEMELFITGVQGPLEIKWDGEDMGEITNINNLTTGEYLLEVTDSLGCFWSENIIIEPVLSPVVESDVLDVTCFGASDGSIIYTSEANLAYSLDGVVFTESAYFTDLSPNEYEILIKDELGCIFSEVVIVDEPNQIEVNLPEVMTINLGTSVVLEPIVNAENEVEYDWEEQQTLDCVDCQNPVAAPLIDTKYILTIYDENNCESQAEIWIRVNPIRDLYVPNVFSPNDDGNNDVFTIQSGDGPVEEVELFQVFGRWGNLLYEANNFQPNVEGFGWDGTHKGQIMDNGVYVYVAVVKFKDGTKTQLSGDITLTR